MGLFSSKKKTSVDTAVMRVVEDGDLSDTVKESTITAIMEGGNVPEYVVDGLLDGVALKFERMWRYGRDHYHYGLPNTNLKAPKDGLSIAREILEIENGSAIDIQYFEVAPPNNIHVARQRLVEEYGYQEGSNQITTLSNQFGYPVYLVDLVPMHTPEVLELSEDTALEVWDLPGTAGYTPDRKATAVGRYARHTPLLVDKEFPLDGARVHYAYWLGGTPVNGTLDFDMSTFEMDSDYVQVKYTRVGESQVRYWTYRIGSNVHPSLDAVYEGQFNSQGTYFPFVVFRREKQNRTASSRHGTHEYETTKKLLDYIGMDFQSLGDTIHDNPDIDDVEQAVMVMAVPARSKDPGDMRYLFEFFKGLYTQSYTSRPAGSFGGGLFGGMLSRITARSLVWKDADFTLKLSYRNISVRHVPGKIGKPGTYTAGEGSFQRDREYTVREFNSETGQYETVTRTRTYTVRGYRYRKQVSKAAYEEVIVEDPTLRYDIWKGYGVNAGVGSSELLIPLDKTIANSFSLKDRERLYMRSLHFVFNSRVTQKVKWYQTGIFKTLVMIAAVVITIYTGLPAWKAAAATLATMTVTAIAWAVVKVVVKVVAMKYAFKFTVKTLGEEAAFIAAIVAAIYGGTQAFRYGSVQGAPFASEALAVANGLGRAVQQSYVDKMQGLQQEFEALAVDQQEFDKEMAEIQDLLNAPNLLNPLVFVEGETPDNFYRRTVHSGNMGELVIDSVHKYVDVALTLPDFNTTAQEFSYG